MSEKEKVRRLVKDWFAKTADYEWKRLKQDAYHQVEFLVTMHFLEKYLPREGFVLDAGGGPGRYTIELAKRGYDVVLLDLVEEMLEIARREIRKEGIQGRVKEIVEGSVTDLSVFGDESFDGVSCLSGPLSHLLTVEERETAAGELVRVAKKGASLFVSVLGRLGVLKTILLEFPHQMKFCRHHLEVGDHIPGVTGEGFTAAHWFLPEELQKLFERQGVETLDLVGLEGLSSHLEEATNELHKDREKWEMWMEIVLDTCNHPSIVGTAEHILYVGKKRR